MNVNVSVKMATLVLCSEVHFFKKIYIYRYVCDTNTIQYTSGNMAGLILKRLKISLQIWFLPWKGLDCVLALCLVGTWWTSYSLLGMDFTKDCRDTVYTSYFCYWPMRTALIWLFPFRLILNIQEICRDTHLSKKLTRLLTTERGLRCDEGGGCNFAKICTLAKFHDVHCNMFLALCTCMYCIPYTAKEVYSIYIKLAQI